LALLTGDENCQPIAQSDASEARWVNLKDLGDYDLVTGLAEIILRTYNLANNDYSAGLYDVDETGSDFIIPRVNFV